MQFSTPIPISKSDSPIDYNSKIVSLGSCFAVNIGQKFDYFKFRNVTNPFGILFHPVALEKFIGFAVKGKQFTETDIVQHNELWHCFDAHSDLSSPNKEILLDNLNNTVTATLEKLKEANHIIITLGTAWVYRHNTTSDLVANCHKIPQKEFTKELLSVDTIQGSISNILSMLEGINPDLTAIFTVSPVRHIKDGFTENQWSKSNLISALHQTIKNKQTVHYFPSYEIMMDELRDYRFYAADMIHPSQVAIDYIWERFSEAYITDEAQEIMKIVDTINKGLNHRPFNPDTEQHRAFLQKLEQKIQSLQSRYPHIIF